MLKKYTTFVNESKNYIGRRVRIYKDDSSSVSKYAYSNGKNGTGTIIDYNENGFIDFSEMGVYYKYLVQIDGFGKSMYLTKDSFYFLKDDDTEYEKPDIDIYGEDNWEEDD